MKWEISNLTLDICIIIKENSVQDQTSDEYNQSG